MKGNSKMGKTANQYIAKWKGKEKAPCFVCHLLGIESPLLDAEAGRITVESTDGKSPTIDVPVCEMHWEVAQVILRREGKPT
jgi:hypothetical protein